MEGSEASCAAQAYLFSITAIVPGSRSWENLFDEKITWNHQSWGIPEILGRLIAEGRVPPTIVVGIWNAGAGRAREYTPMPAYAGLSLWQKLVFRLHAGGIPGSDDYLDFLVSDLKPFIDSHYRTLSDRAHTAIMGSSMGGLISLYAISRRPDIFGAAAGLSTHWPVSTGKDARSETPLGSAFLAYLRSALPDPATHRLYYDHGTEGLDALYGPSAERADAIFAARGYVQPDSWMSRTFPGLTHDENSWRARLDIPLTFILRPRGAAGSQ